ncbi:MAG: sigma-70 family RNA polymerase sigma factor [Planococcaceae bacterium]|nr:sigma-70 family RNA polymerase sigma factor [Planococcaceae bacterium]
MLPVRESSSYEYHILFEDLIDQYSEELLRLAFTYVKNRQAAEDVVQDVFLRAFEKRDDFKGLSSYKTYLYRMTINRCYDHLRSWSFKNIQISNKIALIFHGDNSTETLAITKNEKFMLGKEILTLALKYREVLILYYYKDLNVDEIATILNCSTNTVKTRLKRAREKLKVKLEKRGGY